jgi:hypothetical protein
MEDHAHGSGTRSRLGDAAFSPPPSPQVGFLGHDAGHS